VMQECGPQALGIIAKEVGQSGVKGSPIGVSGQEGKKISSSQPFFLKSCLVLFPACGRR
jgi:hypothetical protein